MCSLAKNCNGLRLSSYSQNLSLSLGTVHNVWKRFEETGEVAPTKQRARYNSRVLSQQYELLLVGLIMEDPTLYLSETCSKVFDVTGIQVSVSTMCKILHRHGFTRKKIHQYNITSKMRGISWGLYGRDPLLNNLYG